MSSVVYSRILKYMPLTLASSVPICAIPPATSLAECRESTARNRAYFIFSCTESGKFDKSFELLKAHKTLAFAGIFTELTLLRFLLNFLAASKSLYAIRLRLICLTTYGRFDKMYKNITIAFLFQERHKRDLDKIVSNYN